MMKFSAAFFGRDSSPALIADLVPYFVTSMISAFAEKDDGRIGRDGSAVAGRGEWRSSKNSPNTKDQAKEYL